MENILTEHLFWLIFSCLYHHAASQGQLSMATRKIIVFSVLILLSAIALPAHAQETGYSQDAGVLPTPVQNATSVEKTKDTSKKGHPDRGVYTGSGLPYITEEPVKKTSGYESELERDPPHTSFGNTQAGYRLNEQFALEVGLDHITGLPGYELSADSEAALDVTSYMSGVKFSPDLGYKTTRPYIVGGFGLMRAETGSEESDSALWFVDPNSESELGPSGKVGFGLELRKDNTSLGFEGTVGSGFGNLAGTVYQSWSMGLTLHW
jgi:hypothetical protein